MPSHTQKHEMTFDFEGLIQLLAGHLYSEKKVFIRELIQTRTTEPFSVGSRLVLVLTRPRAHRHPYGSNFKPGENCLSGQRDRDEREDLEDFLSTIGKSGTRMAVKKGRNGLPSRVTLCLQMGHRMTTS